MFESHPSLAISLQPHTKRAKLISDLPALLSRDHMPEEVCLVG